MGSSRQIVRAAGEGEQRWFYGGGRHTWKVRSEEAGGAFFVIEDELVRGKSTPLHTHPYAELIYLVEGELLLHGDGLERRVTAGATIVTPRDVPHAFTVLSERARMLFFQAPGEGETFYLTASEPATEQDGPVDFRKIGEAAQRTGATAVLGPPPFKTP